MTALSWHVGVVVMMFISVLLDLTSGITTATTNASASSRLEVHFEVCLGMFNQYKAAAGALWLITELAQKRQQERWLRPMHVVLPPLYRMLGREDAMARFDEFFNVTHLQQQLAPLGVTASVAEALGAEGELRCPHVFWVRVLGTKKDKKLRGTRFRTVASLMAYTLARLRRWTHPCILLRVTGKCTLNMGYVAEEKVFVTRHTYLRYASRLHRYALQVRQVLGPYISVHLRTEQDMLATKVVHFPTFEACVWQRYGPSIAGRYPLYLAAGDVVFHYPEYLLWRARTRLRLFNKSDLIPDLHRLRLGREEWAAVEAEILIGGAIFLGYAGSSMTEYVDFEHQQRTHVEIALPPPNGTQLGGRVVMWNQACGSGVLQRRARRHPPGAELKALSRHLDVGRKASG